jgi:uncharacterized caspase-like protein
MPNVAILIGNSNYDSLEKLACCHCDLLAINQLLEATGKYEYITIIEDSPAADLKKRLRESIEKLNKPDELFFYFTGHGYMHDSELFHCSINFDSERPNQTGLSTEELHIILRLAEANLVVKVIDSCHSGTSLIKSEID